MESPSPVPSTPINGLSLQGKWLLRSCEFTPEEESVRKKLFDPEPEEVEEEDKAAVATALDAHQWSSSSEYFSQSVNDASCSLVLQDGEQVRDTLHGFS